MGFVIALKSLNITKHSYVAEAAPSKKSFVWYVLVFVDGFYYVKFKNGKVLYSLTLSKAGLLSPINLVFF